VDTDTRIQILKKQRRDKLGRSSYKNIASFFDWCDFKLECVSEYQCVAHYLI